MFRLLLKDAEGGEASFPIIEDLYIGRGSKTHVTLKDPKISRMHARIFRNIDKIMIEDLGSSNGTFVNGVQIMAPKQINAGDIITIGMHNIYVIETSRLDDHHISETIATGFHSSDELDMDQLDTQAPVGQKQNISEMRKKNEEVLPKKINWSLYLAIILLMITIMVLVLYTR